MNQPVRKLPAMPPSKKPAGSAMTGWEKIQGVFRHEEGPVPWVEITVDETLVLRGLDKPVPAGAYENIKPIDVSWEDRVQFARQAGLDALGIYHWEAYGSTEDDSHPVLKRTPLIHQRSDLPKLQIPSFTREMLAPQVEAARRAIGGSGIALFVEFAICLEYALSDLGFENLCMKMYDDVGFVTEVLEIYTAYSLQLIDIYNQLPGIDFIWIGDDLAYGAGPFFSPDLYRRIVFPFMRKAVQKIEKPWVFHSDGNVAPLMDEILSWKPDAIHPLEPGAMDIGKMKQKYGEQVGLIGNLSVDRLASASPAEVAAETRALLQACSPGGGYGFSSGNSLPRFLPLENVMAVSDTLRSFNQKWE